MATAMLDHVHRFFGLPTGLFCTSCFTADLGAGEADGLGAGLIQSVIILYERNSSLIQLATVALL